MDEHYFVIGDVHGEYQLFTKLLQKWHRENEQLILVGDLLDRGPQSRDCLLLGQRLVEEHGAVYLKGNHEEMLVNYLFDPQERYAHYQSNGGDTTINSLLDQHLNTPVNPVHAASLICEKYDKLIEFLKDRPLYYETEHYIFVHAGVNLELDDWHQSSARDFVWIRNEFHRALNRTGKKIVFGHTPVAYLTAVPNDPKLWIHDDKFGIDGGAVYGGVLHGVRFDAAGLVDDFIVMKEDEKNV